MGLFGNRKSSDNRGTLAGFLTGLVSASFSTLFISLGARRIGRDSRRDWMEVGTVLLRGRGIKADPGLREVAAGILVHQSADIFWATTYGSLLGRLGPGPKQRRLLWGLDVPWALATAAFEYWGLLPWLQPVLKMQVPYWTAASVHLSSGMAYGLFPWIQECLLDEDGEGTKMGKRTATALAVATGVLGAAALYARVRGEPRGATSAFDQRFLRHMTAHHEVGVRLARLAVARSRREETRRLGLLMLGEHEAEIAVMRDWWRSWYGGEMPGITTHEYENMFGMPAPKRIKELEELEGDAFEAKFLPLMVFHHRGAVEMADDAWEEGADPRLRLFADSIRHTQRGQIGWMQDLHRRLPRGALAGTAVRPPTRPSR